MRKRANTIRIALRDMQRTVHLDDEDDRLLTTTQTKLSDVVLNGDTIYWFDGSALRKTSMNNPNVVTVVDGLIARGLIVGATCVVFQDGDQIIKRAPK